MINNKAAICINNLSLDRVYINKIQIQVENGHYCGILAAQKKGKNAQTLCGVHRLNIEHDS